MEESGLGGRMVSGSSAFKVGVRGIAAEKLDCGVSRVWGESGRTELVV